jgi:hypothetical protein
VKKAILNLNDDAQSPGAFVPSNRIYGEPGRNANRTSDESRFDRTAFFFGANDGVARIHISF